MYPIDKAVTIAPTAASHRKIAVAEGPDSILSICAADGLFASQVQGSDARHHFVYACVNCNTQRSRESTYIAGASPSLTDTRRQWRVLFEHAVRDRRGWTSPRWRRPLPVAGKIDAFAVLHRSAAIRLT